MRQNRPPNREHWGAGEQSRVISVRLHPDEEHEARALEVFDTLREQGYTARQIVTNALLHAAGYTPDMFRAERPLDSAMSAIDEKLAQILGAVEGGMGELLRNIKHADPEAFRRFANHDEAGAGDYDLDDDFIQNAQKAARQTFRQRQGK